MNDKLPSLQKRDQDRLSQLRIDLVNAVHDNRFPQAEALARIDQMMEDIQALDHLPEEEKAAALVWFQQERERRRAWQ